MSKRIEDFIVCDNRNLSKDFCILELTPGSQLPEIRPGQFVQIKVAGDSNSFLRLPISVHEVDYDRNSIKLLIQVAGTGTEALSRLKSNDLVNLIYPLGNSFTLPSHNEKVLLAGGGCGIAPLLFLGKSIRSAGISPDILLGFRDKSRIIEYEEYLRTGQVFITTQDGSEGEKGLVTDHSILKNKTFDRIYCCGPEPMMKALALFSLNNNIDCEVSLENLMACGFGACLCCVAETVNGNVCTCIDGPVFNTKVLKW